MGRKKIEIKPLTDERNRNVTFLKRKAGLMKKAYELSVLCGVTVSLLIFNSSGKPYEFSSGDFDAEVDRYNEYEGTIERRRGAEFEAMAKAGEDDDDEDEDDDKPGKAKPNGPSKSLKGKETFKARRTPHRDADRRDRGRDRRERVPAPDETFVGGLVEDLEAGVPPSPRRHSDAAGLQYALGLHQQPNAGPSSSSSGSMPWNAYRQSNAPFGFPFGSPGGGSGPPFLPNSSMGAGSSLPAMPNGNGPWDSSMLTTYAWLQIQQAHQEQKRHLLEKQQQQLLELTSRSGGAALFRDILGGPGPVSSGGQNVHAAATAAGISATLNEFVWPTAQGDEKPASTPPDDDLTWAFSGVGASGSMQAGGSSSQPLPQFGIDYPMTMDGKRRGYPRDMYAAAQLAKRARK